MRIRKATTTTTGTSSSSCCRNLFARSCQWHHPAVRFVVVAAVLFGGQRFYWNTQQKSIWNHADPSVEDSKGSKRKQILKAASSANKKQHPQNSRKHQHYDSRDHTLTLADFPDLDPADLAMIALAPNNWEEAAAERQPLLKLLKRAGLKIDLQVLRALPKWEDVVDLYGPKPIIVGKEDCEVFREEIPLRERFVAVAGQMNSGTNALGRYLKNNIQIKENPRHKGVLVTTPWYKHAWAGLRGIYEWTMPKEYQTVMPVVLIRDPYFWMRSMCQSPYSLEWKHTDEHCPNLAKKPSDQSILEGTKMSDNDGVEVRVAWMNKKGPDPYVRKWKSLAHVWSSWYREYYEAEFPRLFIRFEDLLFHTEEVINEIRECVGAEWKSKNFLYSPEPVKTTEYFAKVKAQSGLVSALIKYGRDRGQRTENMEMHDLLFASQYLDKDLINVFHYKPEYL